MKERELYARKMRAQLDEWQAELDKMKAKTRGAGADAQLELNRQVEKLERRLEEGRAKVSRLAQKGDEAWESVKEDTESAWQSLRAGFSEIRSRFER